MIAFEYPIEPLERVRKRGGQTTYTTEIGAAVCEAISTGLTLKQVAERDDMPSAATIIRWASKNEEFREMYQFALLARYDEWCNEMVKIAAGEPGPIAEQCEDSTKDNPRIAGVKQTIQRAKLELDTRWRVMGKLAPKVYGEPASTPASTEVSAPQVAQPLPITIVPKGTNIFDLHRKEAS